MKKNRGFEVLSYYQDKGINLPKRNTRYSAGYDVEAAEDTVIHPFSPGVKPTLISTGLKAYCQDDECYFLLNRSGGPKKGLIMANGVGLIDKDYYNNESNEGHIFFQYFNCTNEDIIIKKGDRIGQIVFQKFLLTDDDDASGIRTGGFGSTDK